MLVEVDTILDSSMGVEVALVVEQLSPVSIVVRAGSFRVDGDAYEFAEDVTWEFTADPQERMWANGFLALDVLSGDAVLLVDEFPYGSAAERYCFASGGPYKPLYQLFGLDIPKASMTLDDLICLVSYRVAPEV